MSSNVLSDKDVNAPVAEQQAPGKDVKSMEYHRQVFQSKMAEDKYVHTAPFPASFRTRPRRRQTERVRRPTMLDADERLCPTRSSKYVSPSDNIMSPCSAKINALRNKHAAKVKPKSLFAQASVKKLSEENSLGARPAQP
ncbi:spo12-like protein [Ophiocordyceps sinensis CO18]|uniref:Spo12-like protein n=1 Tax=Ophiocordyceps sinensis (strain Co18 / CGMCC 3.14243) TaxID=911162 RepID=T5AIH5_OPHSC|nr:spo12-like protein [Ophiocordyceps sinensis CO18]